MVPCECFFVRKEQFACCPYFCRTIRGAVSTTKQQSRYETVLAKRPHRSKPCSTASHRPPITHQPEKYENESHAIKQQVEPNRILPQNIAGDHNGCGRSVSPAPDVADRQRDCEHTHPHTHAPGAAHPPRIHQSKAHNSGEWINGSARTHFTRGRHRSSLH